MTEVFVEQPLALPGSANYICGKSEALEVCQEEEKITIKDTARFTIEKFCNFGIDSAYVHLECDNTNWRRQ